MHVPAPRTLSFQTGREPLLGGARTVMPCIDGEPLSDRVAEYEIAAGYDPAGNYGPLMPDHYQYGPLEEYFFGRGKEHWARMGGIWVLGCECGEVGCWPLQCRVEASAEKVAWTQFRQPYRPARDYASFGPLVFHRDGYARAVSRLVSDLRLD